MTKLLDQAVKVANTLPEDVQDEIARLMLELSANNGEPEPIHPGHLDGVLEGLAQARDGQFASDRELGEVLARFDA